MALWGRLVGTAAAVVGKGPEPAGRVDEAFTVREPANLADVLDQDIGDGHAMYALSAFGIALHGMTPEPGLTAAG